MEINNNKYVGYDMLSESDCLYNLQMLFAIMSLLRAYVRHALTSLYNLTCLLCPFILYLYQFTLHVVIIHDFCSCQDAIKGALPPSRNFPAYFIHVSSFKPYQ
jgi:hypothetical protein